MEGEPARKRVRARTPGPSATTEEIRMIMEELRLMREEQRQRGEELQHLREIFAQQQLSLTSNSDARNSASGACNLANDARNVNAEPPYNARGVSNGPRDELEYKLKPDSYDGSVSLREFLAQFDLISRASGWSDSAKVVALASCLRGKARSVLEGVTDFENLRYHELLSKLELRFGEGDSAQGYYAQFIGRKQNSGEDLSTLGADLERLARLAYPECAPEVRDKIACSQFLTALSDGFVRRTLQLEGLISLRAATERGKTVKLIEENNSWKIKADNKFNNSEARGSNRDKSKEKECWQCGSKGHFRSECPSLSTGGKGMSD